MPKKAATEEAEASPARGLSNEDQSRMMDMLNRISGLEDVLYKTQEQLHEARSRESTVMGLLREVVGHLNAVDKGSFSGLGSPLTEQNVRLMVRARGCAKSFSSSTRHIPSSTRSHPKDSSAEFRQVDIRRTTVPARCRTLPHRRLLFR